MSSSINVHPNMNNGEGGSVMFEAGFTKWPMTVKVLYADGGEGITGDQVYTIFLDVMGADAIRDMATSAQTMTDALFARANLLDQLEADNG